MANIRPTTRTPGSLKLLYNHNGVQHRCSVNFMANVDINDIALRRADANVLAGYVKAVLPQSAIITAWALYSRPGNPGPPTQLYIEAFAPALVGTAVQEGGMEDYFSATATVTGRGNPGGVGYAVGECKLVLFTGNAHHFGIGEKFTTPATATPRRTLIDALAINNNFWADFYGQKARARANMPIQWNAAIQRKYGA
jgi:hypothetical protein